MEERGLAAVEVIVQVEQHGEGGEEVGRAVASVPVWRGEVSALVAVCAEESAECLVVWRAARAGGTCREMRG